MHQYKEHACPFHQPISVSYPSVFGKGLNYSDIGQRPAPPLPGGPWPCLPDEALGEQTCLQGQPTLKFYVLHKTVM